MNNLHVRSLHVYCQEQQHSSQGSVVCRFRLNSDCTEKQKTSPEIITGASIFRFNRQSVIDCQVILVMGFECLMSNLK